MKYKLYFDVIICDKKISSFMRACDLCDGVGARGIISFTTTAKPTKEYIRGIIKHLENSKKCKELEEYYSCVKHIRTEIIVKEKK